MHRHHVFFQVSLLVEWSVAIVASKRLRLIMCPEVVSNVEFLFKDLIAVVKFASKKVSLLTRLSIQYLDHFNLAGENTFYFKGNIPANDTVLALHR